jgi:Putative transposase/Transposase zinc-binding domain
LRPTHEIANVINSHWKDIVRSSLFNSWQVRTLDAIRRCRTASLGGHVDLCTSCGHVRISYNSCRNRHCPKCQQVQRERWIQAREAELLPATYFHVVFTLPEALNKLCLYQPALVYRLLFDTAWSVMRDFAHSKKHLGADTGMISILHTWGQNLSLHPHIHCIVPGGGVTASGKWKHAPSNGKFLFPVKAMSMVFRARFVAALRGQFNQLEPSFFTTLFNSNWVVYAKPPFGSPKHVIQYLGGYTHKVAISNHRITDIGNDKVTFRYKDYRDQSKVKLMTIDALEFIRRFSLHILPKGFIRIRHYGILSSSRKQYVLPLLLKQMESHFEFPQEKHWKQISTERLGYNPDACPVCKQNSMIMLLTFDRRGPPDKEMITTLINNYQCKMPPHVQA